MIRVQNNWIQRDLKLIESYLNEWHAKRTVEHEEENEDIHQFHPLQFQPAQALFGGVQFQPLLFQPPQPFPPANPQQPQQ